MSSAKQSIYIGTLLSIACVIAPILSCARRPAQWTPQPPSNTPREFDLTFARTDYNGSPLNARWGAHAGGLGLPPIKPVCNQQPQRAECTRQVPSIDTARGVNLGVCLFDPSRIKGHVNWAVAASTGQLLWLNRASDGDYNFMLFPDDDAALTTNNVSSGAVVSPARPYVELEFDSRETVRNFATSFWQELRAVVDKERRGPGINRVINPTKPGEPANAVVYGLLGLDCEHNCASEYHPVYALAIEIDPSPTNNRWAIFVRNWGNEGFCSHLNHELLLPEGKLRLTLSRLGRRPEVVSSASEFASTRNRVPLPAVEFDRQGLGEPSELGQVVLTFTLPPPTEQVTAELILALRWESTQEPSFERLRLRTDGGAALERAEPKGNSAEERLERALGGQIPEQRQLVAVRPNEMMIPFPPVTVTPFVRPPSGGPRRPTSRLQVDVAKLDRDKALVRAVCDSPQGKDVIPPRDFDRVCAAARR
jgi:hypothetical protein